MERFAASGIPARSGNRLGAAKLVDTSAHARASLADNVAGAALALVWLFTVLAKVAGITPFGTIAATALGIYVVLELRRLPKMGVGVFGVALAACAISWSYLEDPLPTLAEAGDVACFFVAVLLSGGFLREAADRSRSVHAAGLALIRQPAGRLNAALSFGGYAMGFILSFGSLQLLCSMAQKANATVTSNPELAERRLRRSMVAILRGFCMSTVCNPLSIVAALALTYAPGAEWGPLMLIVFPCALTLLTFSVLLERGDDGDPDAHVSTPSLRPVLALVLIVAAVIGLVVGVAEVVDFPIIESVMVSVPFAAVAWMFKQHHWRPGELVRRLEGQARVRYPALRLEVVILASAGIAGAFIADALPVDAIALLFSNLNLWGFVLPLLVFWFICIGAQLAMNPILTAAIAGAVLPAPLLLGTPPVTVAAAYMMAWGIGTCVSPFTLSVLITAGIAERDGRLVAWQWNRGFGVAALLFASALLAFLASVM